MRRLKQWIRYLLAAILYRTGLAALGYAWRCRRRGAAPLILIYHRVLPEGDPSRALSSEEDVLPPEEFERHLEFLKNAFRPLSWEAFQECRDRQEGFPARSCLVTFDDGWRDNYDHAFPLLIRAGVPATMFLSTGLVNTKRLYWTSKLWALLNRPETDLAELLGGETPLAKAVASEARIEDRPHTIFRAFHALALPERDRRVRRIEDLFARRMAALGDERQYLAWDEARAMQAGGVAFGSHAHTHEPLILASEAEQLLEMKKSREILEKELGRRIEAVAFPHLLFDERTLRAAPAAGFHTAFGGRTFDGPILLEGGRLALYPRLSLVPRRGRAPWGAFSPSLLFCYITGVLP
ncbi:MAG: polysaccharide deacetylase family protein [Planctomycetota bacterium]